MDDNKNRLKDREKSNAEMRKMHPKGCSDLGIEGGEKIGSTANSKDHLRE